MSDDIDIEEHDILDNPRIRNIFPDLSVVKKEISEYFYEALPEKQLIKEEPEFSESKSPRLGSGTKLSINYDEIHENIDKNVQKSPSKNVKKLDTNISFQKNKIIIGSKPNKSTLHNALDTIKKKQIRCPKIFLHDVRPNLEKSERYCKECRILFPEKSKLTEHVKEHSTTEMQILTRPRINIIKNNKDVNFVPHVRLKKSDENLKDITDESDEPIRMDTSTDSDENIKPSTRSGSSKTKSNENVNSSTSSDTSSSEEDADVEIPLAELNSSDSSEDETVVESITKRDVPRCRICDIRVANRSNLVRHYRAIHRKKLTFISTKTTNKSKRNSSDKLSSPKSKVSKVKTEDARDSSNYCRTCKIKFSSIYSLKRHLNRNRCNIKSTPSKVKIDQRVKAKELTNTKTTNTDTDIKKCFHCNKQFSDSKSLIEHVYQVLRPKRTRNSYRILNKSKPVKRNVESEKIMAAETEPININDLPPTKIKTKNIATNSNKKDLEARKEKSNKINLRPIKIKNTNAINSFKKRFETTNKKYLRSSKREINNDPLKGNGKENKTKDLLFVCQHCTCYFLSIKNYIKHIINRHGTKVSKINRQQFDPQCEYCSIKNPSVIYHNRHLYKEHLDMLQKKIVSKNIIVPKSDESVNDTMQSSKCFAFKSAVFKCGRCDVHFISSETAKDHTSHMEFLINWKCSICDLIFKKEDERMHLLQHLSSDHIAVHEFSSETLSSLLYDCTKCAIHFSEKKYLDHYEKCEKETALSTYCKACDILINEADANPHTTNHNHNDFSLKVITSDIIFDSKNHVNKSNTKNKLKVKRPIAKHDKTPQNYNTSNATLICCPTCQCFMTIVRKIHLKKKCTKMIKRICVECGLLFTGKSINTHRNHHKMKDLTLQDYIFTDLSGKITKPPIPEFPQCEICKVYFVNKSGINIHVCNEFKDISSCNICKIKLSNTAFKLHMAYHNYRLKNEKVTTNNKTPSLEKKQKVESNDVSATTNTTAVSTTCPNVNFSNQDLAETQNASIIKIDPNIAILFTCKSCFITLNTYDKLIEHCQNHPTEAQSLNLRSCSSCKLKFDFPTYEIHNEIHSNKLTIKNLSVDIRHFVFDKKIWVNNVFHTLSPNQINEIIGKSIYESEHRVKLKILQKGPPNLTIYKCARCSLFFDHRNVFRHAKCKNTNIRGTQCASCGLQFLSGSLRNQHLKIHLTHPKINEKSYRIILFNHGSDEEHSSIADKSNQYIIYQCRNCNGVIEKSIDHQCSINDLKKCSKCGLLIYKEKLKNHTLEHKSLNDFKPDTIKVILFGAREAKTDKVISIPQPSFKGLIYDYTLYQCKRCEICVKNDLYISNHVCVFGKCRCQCQNCDLFFNSKSYNHHLKTHNVDPDFKKENINIVQFDLKSNSDDKERLIGDESQLERVTDNKELELKVKVESANKCTVVLYKCKCGLHFVDRCKVIKHIKQCNPKLKTYKQNCTKCSLLFNPSELFTHLVNHHGNKNQPIKYDVKEISDENVEEFDKVILFNCSKCGLYYLDKKVASDHYKSCSGDMGDFEECTKCKIIYDKSSFVLDKHNEHCENKFEIEIIEENNIEVADDTLSQSCENITTEH